MTATTTTAAHAIVPLQPRTETDAAEYDRLTRPHLGRLFRVGMRLTHQPSEAQDLVQEALTRGWANWHRFERSGSLGAWLSRILVNAFISRHRHQKVVDATAARCDILDHLFDAGRLAESVAPERSWHRDEFSDEVLSALETLAPHYREVVELVDIEGLSYKEAASRLDIPLGTVMSRLHRARRLLRDELQAFARDYGVGLGLVH